MRLSRPSARFGLLAAAAALIAVLVAVPSANAASFSGGTIKLDFKALKVKVAPTGANPATKTGGTFAFAENAGTVTMTNQASGNLNIGTSTTALKFTLGKKSITLQSLVEKLTAGKGQLTAKIGGKGKAIAFFDQLSQNRVKPDSAFTALTLSNSNVTLTKAGAAALNKAFGLKKPAKGKKDKRLKAKGKAGTASFTAERSLTVVGGQSTTIYDQAFVQALEDCDIVLSAVAPATAVPQDASAPKGGAVLPINAANGGTLNAETFSGQVNHQGGTSLDRAAGGPKGKAEYHSPLTNFVFGFGPTPPYSLTAFVVNSNNNLPIGTVTGDLVATLTDTGGSVALNNGSLNLSDAAAGTLSQAAPPLGADCPIPAGSKIGSIAMSAQVE